MSTNHNGFVVAMTLIVAFILTLLPMPPWAIWLRPAWVLMVLTYWAMMTPEHVNVGSAWITGVFLDVLEGSLLGEHALALTLSIYFVVRMSSRLRMSPLIQQSISIFFLALLYQFVLFCVQGFLGMPPTSWLYWSGALTSMLLWPWIYSILRGKTENQIV